MNNNGWETVDLSDIVDIKTGRLDSNAAIERGKYPFFTCSPETFRINDYAFDTEAILLAGNNANGVFPIKHYSGKFNAYQRTYVITVKNPSRLYLKYLYYQLSTQLSLLQEFSIGSATKFLTMRILNPLKVPLPSLPEQRAIAGILGALDDKIELNRRMNATLESMARAVFRQWFVENEEVGNWEIGTVIQDFNLTMGQSPPGETYNEAGIGIPFFQGRADFGIRFPSNRVYCTAPTRFANPGDTLVCVRAPVGDLNMASEKCAIGRGVAAIRHKTGSRSYTYYTMHTLEEDFKQFEAGGTVFGSINKTDFQNLKVVIPPSALLGEFEEICYPIDQMIENNEQESRTLASLRDSLLPKLMRGEVRVKDISG